jgi:aspartyl-tRNA(Asn)/glutamyl-tRNA(Gln) amidotransferase subunit A
MTDAYKEAKELDKKYNCYITIAPESKGKEYFAAKDLICTKGIRTTAGSLILENYVPVFDATVISRLKAKGYALVGKAGQDEFGFGTFSTNTFKIPKNPLDVTRSCGGSSGGPAAIVSASKHIKFALATSTGGSISAPASFCGVVGLTPTYGLVSRYGLIDYANSLDKIGVISKTVRETARVLSVIAGHDERDSTSLNVKPQDYTKFCGKDVRGLRIGVPKEYFEGVDKKVAEEVKKTLDKIEKMGAKLIPISLPLTKYALAAYYIIAMSEASTNLAKYCGLRYGSSLDLEGNFNEYFSSVREKYFGKEAKRRILLGTFVRMAGYRDQYYLKALKVRRLIIEEFARAFEKVDIIAAPTMPIIAPKFSEIQKLTPTQNYALDTLTVPPNLAGLPHISIPCGFVAKMPVGLHLIGNHLHEGLVIQVADAYERK